MQSNFDWDHRTLMYRLIQQCRLELLIGDITDQSVDAIVNAANSRLAGGGGVDGAIHRAAGSSIMEETRRRYPEGCSTGDAVATRAGKLNAKYIFHAVGPIWRGGREGEEVALRNCVHKCLELSEVFDCKSIAFPAISTGVYGYPLDLAADATINTIVAHLKHKTFPETTRIVLFNEAAFGQFARVLESMT
ncbi:macro domain-containing protein [Calycomorphotria hydatis]|uniref:O-acetyl-ADP-ribose deacetylase n=1 Tax=Calycomorphotria hydatis TaxID=2528027 RepID=A0A517T5Z0_9PLAN|nr:macro domain-containing protein [Calycomorphotria hydatis]QDT63784.1 O-acetyl-ADP-ribose deacetylase [Calycomorphotria hydatis]